MSKQRFGPKGMHYEGSYRVVQMNADGSGEARLKLKSHKSK